MKKKKTKKSLEKERQILDLLDKLNSSECLESQEALSTLLGFPRKYFKDKDLKRLASCGNERYQSFAKLFLTKTN